MQLIKIPKKTKGEFREIAVPNEAEKSSFRYHLGILNDKVLKLCSRHVHGFVNKKSPATNALAHTGKAYSLSFDLSNFFDSVREFHLKGKLKEEEIKILMPDGRAYQGLPTSPAVSNLAATDMDKAIIKKVSPLEIVYTRYADDLTFSFDDFSHVSMLRAAIPEIVSRCGFKINENKTRLQDSRYGRRVITGVSVNEDIKVPRKVRRKIRAAQHQNNVLSLSGLREWEKLKIPAEKKIRYNQTKVDELTEIFNIKSLVVSEIPEKEEIEEGDFIVTGDLAYTLGISNYTTNWKSCMTHPTGVYHTKVHAWSYLKGTRVAALLSNDTKTFAGFERRTMRARALVHNMRDGKIYYDRIYAEDENARKLLIEFFNSKAWDFITLAPPETKVEGHVLSKRLTGTPYCDNLTPMSGKAVTGRYAGEKVFTFKRK
jgi:hypothetical protein